MSITIRVATVADAAAITALLLPNTAAHGGALYGDWSLAVVQRWLGSGSPIVVATEQETLTGVLFSAEKRDASAPPAVAMLQAYPGEPNAYVYGPVCIDASMRGKGILEKLVGCLEKAVGGRQGILFINAGNEASLRAHERLGMRRVAEFLLKGEVFHVLTTGRVLIPS